jgi:peptidyl-prolyl cis-trans isomerase C
VVKKAWLVLVVLVSLGMLMDGCRGCREEKAEPEEVAVKTGKVLAVVNGEEITEAELKAELEGKPEFFRRRVESAEGRKEILENLIERKLLMQATEREGIADDAEIEAKVQAYRERLMMDSLKKKVLSEPVEVTEDEMRAYYEKHKFQFNRPELIHVRQIVLSDKKKADEVYSELKSAPHRFEEMARKHSEAM